MRKGLILLVFFTCSLTAKSQLVGQIDTVATAFERGIRVNGHKVGEWKYCDFSHHQSLIFNHSNGTIKYLEKDTSEYLTLINGEWVGSKLQSAPRYLGSYELFFGQLRKNLVYPPEAIAARAEGKAWLILEIDTTGVVFQPRILDDPGFGIGDAIVSAFNKIPNQWLSAHRNGRFVNTIISIPIWFCLDGCPPSEKLLPYKVLREIQVIEALGEYDKSIPYQTRDMLNTRVIRDIKWAPDDQHILYREVYRGVSKLYISDLNGNRKKINPIFSDDQNGAWAPTGDKIIFDSWIGREGARITIYDLKKDTAFVISNYSDSNPDISVEELIAFHTYRGKKIQLRTFDLRTGTENFVVKESFKNNLFPKWAPDASKLAYTSRDDETLELRVFDVRDSSRKLTPVLGVNSYHWLADSRSILVSKISGSFSQYVGTGTTHYYGYYQRREQDFYRNISETDLYIVDVINNTFELLEKKMIGVTSLSINKRDEILVSMRGSLFLFDRSKKSKRKIVANAQQGVWSNGGDQFAYVSTKDEGLYISKPDSTPVKITK